MEQAGGPRSTQTASKWDHDLPGGLQTIGQLDDESRVPNPIPYANLKPDAKRAHDDFSFFSERYLCREPVPWREEAADLLVAALASPTKDYFGINCPPGSGKTSLALDVALWSLVRQRGIRILLGAEVLSVAASYLRFVRDRLTATVPFKDREGNTAAGVLPLDFGRFQSQQSSGDITMWTNEAIIVAQLDGADVFAKEPSVMIASRDSGFMGNRFDLELWDDLVTLRTYKDSTLPSWWRREAEPRLDPGGALALVGTRLGVEDLFQDCFERQYEDDDGVVHQKYHRIVFSAHDDEECDGDHDQRCLLDPKRVPWSDIVAAQDDPAFGTTYQQDPSLDRSGLIEKLWLTGGIDSDGQEFAGCLEPDRALCEHPNVAGLLTYCTVDPALSTGMWGIEVWATTRRQDGDRYLLDGIRAPMRLDDFLRLNGDGSLSGVMMDLQVTYQPRTWIIEGNFSKGFGGSAFDSLSFKFHNIDVLWPRTGTNKTQGQASVEALLPPLFRSGRVHLPFRDEASRAFVRQFIAELTSFPHGRSSDLVMSFWLGESQMRSILAKGTQQGHAVPNIAHGGHYDSRHHQQGTGNPDPEWHQRRNHPLTSCSQCEHPHWCVTCQGYPLCPVNCPCDRQSRFIGETPQPAPRAGRLTIGLGEYGRPSRIAQIAAADYNNDGTVP
jgi:hypothetical protein